MHRFLVAFTLATASFASVASLGACGGGQRFRYPTADAPLRLDRVVLYRNGVGYFERSGRIEGDLLTLKVRKDQVNDLLKSLTIVDRSTGRAVSVSHSGGPIAASRSHGWSSGAPSSTQVGPSQETPARGSSVLAA